MNEKNMKVLSGLVRSLIEDKVSADKERHILKMQVWGLLHIASSLAMAGGVPHGTIMPWLEEALAEEDGEAIARKSSEIAEIILALQAKPNAPSH